MIQTLEKKLNQKVDVISKKIESSSRRETERIIIQKEANPSNNKFEKKMNKLINKLEVFDKEIEKKQNRILEEEELKNEQKKDKIKASLDQKLNEINLVER